MSDMLLCPECNSDDVRVISTPYDFGRCQETGYYDEGVNDRWYCDACGASGDDVEGDLVVKAAVEVTV